MIQKTCRDCGQSMALCKFAKQTYASGNVAYRPICIGCRRISNAAAVMASRARRRAREAPPVVDARSYTPPTDFLPMPPPLVRVALVWSIAA